MLSLLFSRFFLSYSFFTKLTICLCQDVLVIGVQMNLMSKTPKIELLLHPREVLNLDNRQQRMAIECKNGVIWVTCAGETGDHILQAGRRYVPKAKGPIVIEAIDEACVDIEENK
jgi:hypothetical protein